LRVVGSHATYLSQKCVNEHLRPCEQRLTI
jgi:hypothetical protein